MTTCTHTSYQYADNLTRVCNSSCSNSQYAYKPSTAFNGSCLFYCPDGYFSDSTTMHCVLKCPDGYFGQTTNNTCRTTCPQQEYQDSVNNLCQI